MKKTATIISLFALSVGLMAHPAADVSLNPDYTAKTVEVVYKHVVMGSGGKHYIDDIKLKLNGKQIITQILTAQESEKGGMVKYSIPELKNGDLIEADTHCNKGGNKSGSIGGNSKKATESTNK